MFKILFNIIIIYKTKRYIFIYFGRVHEYSEIKTKNKKYNVCHYYQNYFIRHFYFKGANMTLFKVLVVKKTSIFNSIHYFDYKQYNFLTYVILLSYFLLAILCKMQVNGQQKFDNVK